MTELKVKSGANQEAGHIVIAAVLGLTLRPDGLMVADTGEGLSVYTRWVRSVAGTTARKVPAKRLRNVIGSLSLEPHEHPSLSACEGNEFRLLTLGTPQKSPRRDSAKWRTN